MTFDSELCLFNPLNEDILSIYACHHHGNMCAWSCSMFINNQSCTLRLSVIEFNTHLIIKRCQFVTMVAFNILMTLSVEILV